MFGNGADDSNGHTTDVSALTCVLARTIDSNIESYRLLPLSPLLFSLNNGKLIYMTFSQCSCKEEI